MKDTFTRILETKTLRVGTDATYPLFETKDAGGNLVGFDIDLMNGLCEEMGVKAEFVVVPFDGIIPGLENEKYDAIISAMTITPKRGERVNFTQPYYLSGQSIAVREEEERIKGVEDLIGKKIGVQLATTGEMEAKKIEGAEVVSFDDILMAFTDLKNGNVDAVINDVPVSRKIISMKKGMKIVGPLLTNESYGIAVRKEDSKLLVAINKALESHKKKGKYEKLEEKWFGGGK
ncbi:basic amino acid ABC transporter substrate-binding protein [candidate division TA06 bacterium]|nr:basic amino acid ABC transporter substrate-binding protein [candidate division TA06 bacterium]